MELVSVIITTFGRTDFLDEAIKSVINQTYPELEIIVVDDNAEKPQVRHQVEDILKKYPQCRLIQNPKNLGGSLSRNQGIQAAHGSFISFLDDDDVYLPTRIEDYLNAYEQYKEKEKIGLIYSFVDTIDEHGNPCDEKYRYLPEKKPLFQHMRCCLAATSQWMIPANIFQKVGRFEDTPCKQDSIMLLKILGAGYQPLCVQKVLSLYRQHSTGRISGIGEKNLIGLQNFHKMCQRYYDQLTKAETRQVEIYFAGQKLTLLAANGRKKESWEQLRIMLEHHAPISILAKGFLKCVMMNTYQRWLQR